MYSQTSFHSASKKSSSKAPQGVTALLLGVIVCYQIVNYTLLHSAVSNVDDESDSACAAVPGASGYSSLCMESQLFKGWHEDLPAESPEELESLLSISPTGSLEQKPPVIEAPATAAPTSATTLGPATEIPALRGDATINSTVAEVKKDALEGMLWDLAWQLGGGEKSHEAPDKHHKAAKKAPKSSGFMAKKAKTKKPSFAIGLTDLQRKLEAKMQYQAQRHAEHRAMRALHEAARMHPKEPETKHSDNLTPWARNLEDLTHELEAHMQSWRKERSEHTAAFAAAHKHLPPPKYDVVTPWAHNLENLTHDLQEHMEVRNKERAEHAAARAAAHAASEKVAPRSAFRDEIDRLGREMCQDPARRDRAACAQFLHPNATVVHSAHTGEKAHDNAMAHIKLLETHLDQLEKDRTHDNQEISDESREFLREMCADPSRHSYPSCARFLPSASPTSRLGAPAAPVALKAAAAPEVPAGLRAPEYPHVLRWAPPKSSQAFDWTQHAGASQLLMSRQELRVSHWDGKVPKVGCVTVLPQGRVTESLMTYFIDNYKLQHYDGERELVLVYHNDDKESARIAHLYADGKSVKAASARGADAFPSATAFRYGAWLARDADLVVRWDFEAWHHPHRISMQVRAITLAKRSVSLLDKVTAFDAEGKHTAVRGGDGPHGSMMGEAAWMRRHWMPLLEAESAVVHGLHSRDVVQIAMPELLTYHDASMLSATTAA